MKVSATQLKAKPGVYMQAVRSGKSGLVTDRGVSVSPGCNLSKAQQPPSHRGGRPGPGSVAVLAVRLTGTNSLDLLAANRRR